MLDIMYIQWGEMERLYCIKHWKDEHMNNSEKETKGNNFESTIKEYLKQGREKLEKDLAGTREAVKIISRDKVKEFMKTMDKGLNKEEREYLHALIVASMYQSFCYGYGIGKMEGRTNNRVFL